MRGGGVSGHKGGSKSAGNSVSVTPVTAVDDEEFPALTSNPHTPVTPPPPAPSATTAAARAGNGDKAGGGGERGAPRKLTNFRDIAPHVNAYYTPTPYTAAITGPMGMAVGAPGMAAPVGGGGHAPYVMPGAAATPGTSEPMRASASHRGGARARRTSGGSHGDLGSKTGDELASCVLQIELKRFYFDLRANDRGVFLKIAEAEAKGTRSKITVPGYSLVSFRDILDAMVSEASKEQAATPEPTPSANSSNAASAQGTPPVGASPSKVEVGKQDGDVQPAEGGTEAPGEGRAAALAALGAEAVASGTAQTAVIEGQLVEIPATGLPTTLASRTMRADSKKYYFDLLSNAKGRYLKISQSMSGSKRSSVVVPVSGIALFRNAVHDMCKYAHMTGAPRTPPSMPYAAAAPGMAYPMLPPPTAAGLAAAGAPPPSGTTGAAGATAASAMYPLTATGALVPPQLQPASAPSGDSATGAPAPPSHQSTAAHMLSGATPIELPLPGRTPLLLHLYASDPHHVLESAVLQLSDENGTVHIPYTALPDVHRIVGELLYATHPTPS